MSDTTVGCRFGDDVDHCSPAVRDQAYYEYD